MHISATTWIAADREYVNMLVSFAVVVPSPIFACWNDTLKMHAESLRRVSLSVDDCSTNSAEWRAVHRFWQRRARPIQARNPNPYNLLYLLLYDLL